MKNHPPFLYYVTAHGYGHGVRSCDLLRALYRAAPERPLTIVSDLPESFFRMRLPGVAFQHRAGSFDVGMAQIDAVRIDLPETLRRVQQKAKTHDRQLEEEVAFLKAIDAASVICDIPALPLEAAAQANIPRFAIGNFSWSWIYEPFAERDPAWRPFIEQLNAGYAQTDLLFRLPFAEPMREFPRQKDVPLFSEPTAPRREDVAALTGAHPDKRWILLAFTKLNWPPEAVRRLCQTPDTEFFSMKPMEWTGPSLYGVDRTRVSFSELLASCDAVLTKPGFGICSESVANRKPMMYIDREHFREHKVLVKGIQRYLKHVHLPQDKLYAGDVCEAIEALDSAPEPLETPPLGGADLAAEILCQK